MFVPSELEKLLYFDKYSSFENNLQDIHILSINHKII